MAEIALRNVCKQFDSTHYGVKDFTLDIHDKEFVIFVGPSGCGKSTTLRLIAGLEDITDGELWIDEELCNYLEPKEREMSMVFQNYALYPNMTVYGNIAYSLKIRKVPKKEIDQRVREVARILEIESLLDRKPAALSGGQKQRVAIGAAIIRQPKAFLMDEPLSNLDAKLRAQMRVELQKLHKQLDTTIIYVTHDQTEAMTLGTKIVVMKDGLIQQVDTPQNIYDHPVNKFVAGFVGAPTMNFIECEVEKEFDKIVLLFATTGPVKKVSDDNIKAAYEGYHRVEAEQYSEEIKKTIQYLYEQLEKYSLVNIYQQIYDESVQVFKEKNGVKSITGKCHRYDLYVQLMFAMKYFNKKIGNMQFICVDEGQDLAVNEYRLLSELNQNHVVFNIFGDTNQLMKSGRGISDWNLLLSELQAEQYVLNENYRNTNQITRFCNDNFGLKTLQTGVDGPKVREISRRDLEKELAGLMITTERIAILLPRTVQKMKYLDMDILPENIRNMIGETMDNGFISVMYVDEVKGIEFDKVFVVSAAMHRNEKYIAYTRALSELIVVVDEKLMNNNSAKKVKENIEHNKKAGIHSAKMTGTLKWEKTKQPKAYTLEKTIDNDVITYHFTENTKSIIKNEFANTDSILPSSIASSPLTNIKKNIYAHCVYIENSICYNINCKENMGKKCNKEGNCDYYISLPVPPDEEELIAEDIDNAKKYLAKYS